MTEDFQHDWFSKPGDTVLALMQRRDVSPFALAERLDGNMQTVRDLLNGMVSIDCTIAVAIADTLGGTPAFWLRRQANYDAALDRAVAAVSADERRALLEHVPIPGSRGNKVTSGTREASELRSRLAFFNVNDLNGWRRRYGFAAADIRFRTSASFTSDEGALALWLRQGELEADMTLARPWNPALLRNRLGDLRSISKISRPSRFLPRIRALLAEAGVALAIVRAPKGCRASGASQLLTPEKAMIVLSFRHRSDDQFWFTLFHEIGHLLLHGGRPFVDDEGTPFDDLEREANEFASDCVVPEERRGEFDALPNDRDCIIRFSVSIGVPPGLVVGQMQYRGMLSHERRNGLKRHYTWDEIEAAVS